MSILEARIFNDTFLYCQDGQVITHGCPAGSAAVKTSGGGAALLSDCNFGGYGSGRFVCSSASLQRVRVLSNMSSVSVPSAPVSTGRLWWWRCVWWWNRRGWSPAGRVVTDSAAGSASLWTRCWRRPCRSKGWCRSSNSPAASGW